MPLTDNQSSRVIALRKKGWLYKEIAYELSISEDMARRAANKAGISGPIARSSARSNAPKIGGSPKDREIIRLRDEVSRLTSEIAASHRDQLLDDEVRKILHVLGDKEERPPTWLTSRSNAKDDPEVPVVIWSDWHAGEVVTGDEVNGVNSYDLATMRRRVRKLVDRTGRLAERHGGTYPGIVINLLGDFISGGLHPELAKTDEIESIAVTLEVRDILIWGIKAMADRFGKVYLPCTAGNHGRNTQKPEFKRYVYKNFDWMLYKLLERYFQDDDRLHFDIRPSNEVFYKIWDRRFLALHGDMLGVKGGDGIIGSIGPIMRGEVKVRGSSVSTIGDYDYLLMGHFHQSLWLPRAIVANTLKGYDEYAKNKLRAPFSRPSQPLFFVHPVHGITSRWEIYLEDSKPASTKEWVSILKGA